MKYISLFAGIGWFDLALNKQGHECVFANEWDQYSAIVYEKNFKSKPDTRDIRTVQAKDIPSHDLLVGGFPCQAFSIAGKRRGFEDTRGTLFYEIARILKAKRPPYLLLENVKGLLNHDNGKTFTTIMRTLDELGYECQWQVLNSKNFGVPQNRERVYVIGHLRGQPRPKVFPLIGGAKEDSSQITSTALDANYWKGIDNHGQRTAIIEYLNDVPNMEHVPQDSRVFSEDGISPALSVGHNFGYVAIKEVRSDEAKRIRRESLKRGRDFCPRREKDFEVRTDGTIGALTSSRNMDSLITNFVRIRKLTPIECERLQGFPDTHTAHVSDTQRYKQLGNAVTVNVVEEIVKRLFYSIDNGVK